MTTNTPFPLNFEQMQEFDHLFGGSQCMFLGAEKPVSFTLIKVFLHNPLSRTVF